ncbi:MAG: hypothetical protein HY855_22235 [Burkholderiales bacterium]|nr:hypothetical protein [Burkholderiales bacterium]
MHADTMTPRLAAAEVLATQLDYAQRGRSLAQAALAGARHFVEWAHYPQDDCVDRRHGARFFYHAHDAAERAPNEHGHFHVFVTHADTVVHLVGISIDANGLPTRLFTTNGWVTGGAWLDAGAMQPLLAGFSLQAAGRLAPLARWISGMVHLYQAQIAELLHERDLTLAAWVRQHAPAGGLAGALQDRAVHIVSQRPVSLLARLDEMMPAPGAGA